MRSYCIDQLDIRDTTALRGRLEDLSLQSSIAGMFWLPVPDAMLTDLQKEHQAECGPFALGLEVTNTSICLELLVRARGKMRCECIRFADAALRDHMISYLESQLHDLSILF